MGSHLKHQHTEGEDVSFVCEVRLVYQCLWRHIQNSAGCSGGEVLNTGGTELGLTKVADLSNAAIFGHQHILCCQVAVEDACELCPP